MWKKIVDDWRATVENGDKKKENERGEEKRDMGLCDRK